MQMFRVQVTISIKSPKRLPCESFVIQSDGHGINMLPDHPVQLPHSPMDSIQQPKNSNSNSNRNRNIGQRDVRFLFRIAAILDGLACVPGNSLYLYWVLSGFFFSGPWDSVPFEAFSQHRTKGIADNVCTHKPLAGMGISSFASGSDWSLTNFN